jgi:signal transduction histidine kinase
VLATVSLATRRVWWECAAVAVLLVVCITGYYAVQPTEDDEPTWVFALMAVSVAVTQIGWGMFIGSRRELIWTLERRAERAEEERDLRVAQARATERARIAREMHDVLAHRISHVSLHAGAMAFREDLDLDELRANAELIQTSANEALTELRSVLGVLRDGETGETRDGPQPTYADLRELVDDARTVGVEVDFVDRVDPADEVPAGVGRTVYRIVQEGITNARKHAPGTPVTVHVSGDPRAGVSVDLTNPLGRDDRPPPPGAGLGLVGLGERAHLRGGRLEAGPRNGLFRLSGWLPWAP